MSAFAVIYGVRKSRPRFVIDCIGKKPRKILMSSMKMSHVSHRRHSNISYQCAKSPAVSTGQRNTLFFI